MGKKDPLTGSDREMAASQREGVVKKRRPGVLYEPMLFTSHVSRERENLEGCN